MLTPRLLVCSHTFEIIGLFLENGQFVRNCPLEGYFQASRCFQRPVFSFRNRTVKVTLGFIGVFMNLRSCRFFKIRNFYETYKKPRLSICVILGSGIRRLQYSFYAIWICL